MAISCEAAVFGSLAPPGEVPGNVRLHCGHDLLSCGARESLRIAWLEWILTIAAKTSSIPV